ncbi:ATPase PAAT [Centroberyx affinis]|uniref:ATPase PAAT n=1 Tax=Centroberyx affinis TaxID=166261 RepID=UPI003A5BF91F
MADVAVENGPGWVCGAAERRLADVLLPVLIADGDDKDLSQTERDESDRAVLLEQTEEGSPCILTLRCSPAPSAPPAAISSLLVVSEARTMEVYNHTGDYCGTGRGEREEAQTDSADRGPFYRKQLVLDPPSSCCEVKLLSLGGRSSVLVCRIVLGLRPPRPGPAPGPGPGPGIDLQRVQSLVEEMGSSLSPGAQSLMDMVQFQQQNQAGALSGFLPLLMGGGASSVLSRAADRNGPQPAQLRPPASARPPQNGAPRSDGSGSDSSPPGPKLTGLDTEKTVNSGRSGPVSHAQLAQMMSHFLNGQGRGQALSPAPELLPMLQSVCGQVTQLRLDDAEERSRSNGAWELDSAMERRLEQMERRLKEHIDRRLDALEQKLETALLSALSQGAAPGLTGGASEPPPPHTAQTPPVPQ